VDILFRTIGFIVPKTIFFLVFESFDFERTWWRLLQKRVVHITFYICVFIFNYFILRCVVIHEHHSRLPTTNCMQNLLKGGWFFYSKHSRGRVTAINSMNKWQYMACVQSKCWRCLTNIPYFHRVVELVLIDLKYILFESRSKWKNKSINRSVSSTRRSDGLLTALSTVVLIRFGDYQHRIYPTELEVKDTTDTQSAASHLDLHLEVDNGGQMRLLHFSNSQLPLHQ
jgi:hypothetical protein